MSHKTFLLTREELYHEVWKTPLIKLAKEFGISDRWLAKICKNYQIPLPGVGYWAKVQAGQNLFKIPLSSPKMTDANKYRFERPIHIHATQNEIEFPMSLEIQKAINFEKEEKNRIKVNLKGRLKHPIVIQAKKSLLKKSSEKGILQFHEDRSILLRVTQQTLSRALHILDCSLLAIEARGHQVILTEETAKLKQPKIRVFDATFSFRIVERIMHKRSTVKKMIWDICEWDYIPSGELRFEFEGHCFCQAQIADTRRQPLEEKINTILIKIYETIAYIRDRDERLEKQRKQCEEEQLERERRAREKELYELRFRVIIDAAQNWKQINLAQEFLKEIANKLPSLVLTREEREKIENMLTWAKENILKRNPILRLTDVAENFECVDKNNSLSLLKSFIG